MNTGGEANLCSSVSGNLAPLVSNPTACAAQADPHLFYHSHL
jgi:hypothetical protein